MLKNTYFRWDFIYSRCPYKGPFNFCVTKLLNSLILKQWKSSVIPSEIKHKFLRFLFFLGIKKLCIGRNNGILYFCWLVGEGSECRQYRVCHSLPPRFFLLLVCWYEDGTFGTLSNSINTDVERVFFFIYWILLYLFMR